MSIRQLKISNSITTRETKSIEKYLQEIKKSDLITPEEEVGLAIRIFNGDLKARDQLVKANLRFVVSVAKQFQHQGLTLEDLINEGNIGLLRAANTFDHTRGFRFISYAVWWIRQQIVASIAENAQMVRIPLNKFQLKNQLEKATAVLEQKLERTPSPQELAEQLGIDIEDVVLILNKRQRHLSFDQPISEEGEDNMIDVTENPNAEKPEIKLHHHHSLKIEIERSFQILNNRQKKTLCYFFGIGIDRPRTLDDIADELNLTRERIRQIKDKAIEKLRLHGNLKVLREYLDAA